MRSTAAVDKKLNHFALGETVIQLAGHRYWLYSSADPETNSVLHMRL